LILRRRSIRRGVFVQLILALLVQNDVSLPPENSNDLPTLLVHQHDRIPIFTDIPSASLLSRPRVRRRRRRRDGRGGRGRDLLLIDGLSC